jgi:EpsI family protein
MRTTADVSVTLLRAVGVPVFREGQFVTLPGGQFEVADVCAGLHFVTSGTIVALLFAYLTYRSNLKRVAFIVAVAATMVLGNGVRAFVVMIVASATNMRVLAGRDHVFFGWLLFSLILFGLMWVGARFADVPESRNPEAPVAEAKNFRGGLLLLATVLAFAMLAVTARDFQSFFSDWILLSAAAVLLAAVLLTGLRRSDDPSAARIQAKPYHNWWSAAVVCVACGVLGIGPLLGSRPTRAAVPQYEARSLPPLTECGMPAPWSPRWQPAVEAPTFVTSGTYGCVEPVSVFLAAYAESDPSSEIVNSNMLPSDWRPYSTSDQESFENAAGRVVAVNEVQIRRIGDESLVWFWYRIGDRTATSVVGVKLLQALEFVTTGSSGGEVYILETPLAPALESGRQRLRAVASQLAAESFERPTP